MVDQDNLKESNLATVRRLLEEGFGGGSTNWLPEQVSPDYVGHLASGDHYGPEGVRIDIMGYRSLVADLTVEIEDLFCDGDMVGRRFTFRGVSLAPSDDPRVNGTPVVMTGIAIDRLVDGLLLESWVQMGPLLEER
jgi:predicted ester cyclase